MDTMTHELETVQNLGLVDRVVRFILAAALLGGAIAHLMLYGTFITPVHGLFMVLSIYPGLTSIVGWDPFYQMIHVKSCGIGERNQCGTFPYEIDAAMGHHPVPNSEWDHSLTGSHY